VQKQIRQLNAHSGLGGVSGLSVMSGGNTKGSPGPQGANFTQKPAQIRKSMAFQKGDVNSSELET